MLAALESVVVGDASEEAKGVFSFPSRPKHQAEVARTIPYHRARRA